MARSRAFITIVLTLMIGAAFGDAVLPELVQVGNLRIEAKVEGTGSPAVIFESGFTGGLFLWAPDQSQIAKQTLTLSYERAGLGRSDVGPQPRSAEIVGGGLSSGVGYGSGGWFDQAKRCQHHCA